MVWNSPSEKKKEARPRTTYAVLPNQTQHATNRVVYIPIEHGCVLEHVRKHDKDNFTASNVDLIAFPFRPSLSVGDNAVLDVEIHLIFGFKEQTANQLSVFRFNFNDSPFRVVKDNNRNPDAIIAYD
jgi:hypothetical protein